MMYAVEELKKIGYKFIVIGEQIQFEYHGKGEPPENAKALFAELKQKKQEAVRYLSWDEGTAMNKLNSMNRRISMLPWKENITFDALKISQPELYDGETLLSNAIDESFKNHDINDLERNIARYEALMKRICEEGGKTQ
jgi:hypothetical protein